MSTSLIPPEAPTDTHTDGELAAARRRIINRLVYRLVVTSWGVLAAVCIAIWWLTTPAGHFWPLWPILGWTGAAIAWGLAISIRTPLTDAAIAAEAARFRTKSTSVVEDR